MRWKETDISCNATGFSYIKESYTVVEHITEGCSGDEKYKLEKDGKYFLLRVGDRAKMPEKKKEYDRLKAYRGGGINTHKPVAFGTAGDQFYSLVSWVSGTPVMDIVKKDVLGDHYQLGRKVGMELHKLHRAGLTDAGKDWQGIMEDKAAAFLENYHHQKAEIIGANEAERYIHGTIAGESCGRWNIVTALQGDRSTDILTRRRICFGLSLNSMWRCMLLSI